MQKSYSEEEVLNVSSDVQCKMTKLKVFVVELCRDGLSNEEIKKKTEEQEGVKSVNLASDVLTVKADLGSFVVLLNLIRETL